MNFRIALAVVTASGFIALSYEILWFRAYAFVTQGSPLTFGLLLGSYLMGIALGSLGSRRLCRDRTSAADPGTLRQLAVFVLLASLTGYLVVPALAWLTVADAWLWSLVLVAIAAGLMGATLPLVAHFGVAPDDLAGARISYIYLANILGSAAGSLVTGFVLMDLLVFRWITVFLTLAGLGLALLIWLSGSRGRPVAPALGVAAALALVVTGLCGPLLDQLWERLQYGPEFESGTRFAWIHENRHGVITVTDEDKVYGGGAYDGVFNTSLVEDSNWIVRGYAVAAMHPEPADVLVIGLSTGSWTHVLAHMPGVKSVTVVEINPGYVELIPAYPQVAPVLGEVEVVIDDGRRWLNRHPDRKFDVIVQNTTHHWRAHITSLLSIEYLELIRGHLAPGGIFHYNTTWSPAAMKTAVTVYPHVLRVYNFMAVSDSPISFDAERWRKALLAWEIDGVPAFDLGRERDAARLEEVLGLATKFGGAEDDEALETRDSLVARLADTPVITDDNMETEWYKVRGSWP